MSDTPRCDWYIAMAQYNDEKGFVTEDFARSLERELADYHRFTWKVFLQDTILPEEIATLRSDAASLLKKWKKE